MPDLLALLLAIGFTCIITGCVWFLWVMLRNAKLEREQRRNEWLEKNLAPIVKQVANQNSLAEEWLRDIYTHNCEFISRKFNEIEEEQYKFRNRIENLEDWKEREIASCERTIKELTNRVHSINPKTELEQSIEKLRDERGRFRGRNNA